MTNTSTDTAATPTGRRRRPLSHERVVAAAVAVADDGGVEAVSMRRVAAHLAVEAMSLYHHVANKDVLLDAIVDHVFAQVDLPSPDERWREAMRRRCTSMREVLARHPWALGLVESRTDPGPATLAHHDAVLGCLRAAGFDPELAGHAFALLDGHAQGFVLQEANLPFGDADELHAVAEEMDLEGLADSHPNLAWFATEHALQPGYAFGDAFTFGLDLVLDGLERELAART